MVLTDAMRGYARKSLGVPDGGDDATIQKALGDALLEERIPADLWTQLKANKTPDGRQMIVQVVQEQIQPLVTAIGDLAKHVKGGDGASGNGGNPNPPANPPGNPPAPNPTLPALSPDMQKAVDVQVRQHMAAAGVYVPAAQGGQPAEVNPTAMLSRAAQAGWLADGTHVRVKSVVERFDRARREARYPDNCKHVHLRGARVTFPDEGGPGAGRPLDFASAADKAVVGAWFKWQVQLTNPGGDLPGWCKMTEQDWHLLNYAIHEMPWTGMVGGLDGTPVDGQKLADVMHRGVDGRKALLDDSTSGGIQAAPIVIEDQLILIPLLYGELFPKIPVINLTRGRRIHAATMGTPTFTAGTPEGTPIPLFDTTNFLGTFDTQVYTAVGSMELGLDFEDDTPADIGGTVIRRYGEAALQYLDFIPAMGDGVTQALGIFNAAGLTVVASANGNTGPLTVADAEGLMFGVNKAYRTARAGNNVFIGNEVTYRRFRAVPLGSTWANSRAFGNDYNTYQVLGLPYAVVPSVPNNWISFANLGFYRMYRRLGLTVRVETAGKTLALANTKVIVVRMRYGGQPEQGGAFSVMTDAPL